MERLLVMSAKERERLKIFLRVKRGELQQKEAAALCQLDYRYLRRLYQRYCQQGDRGLVHQGLGRPSNRARAAAFRTAVLARFQERYPDFGPTLAAEKLTLDGLVIDHETLRRWLMKAGLWQRRRKRKRHRSWRERRAHFGELVGGLSIDVTLYSRTSEKRLLAVTTGNHPLVGVRMWRVEKADQANCMKIITEAYDQAKRLVD